MINIAAEFEKIALVNNTINTVTATISTNQHMNDLIKAAHSILENNFVINMTTEALQNPKKFSHMYEWGMIGVPQGKLWKNTLKGRGANRVSTFEFIASKKTVPVSEEMKEHGVKQNHVFVWKAPILEYGLPVRISPKLASAMVFEVQGKVIFYSGSISISRQGNPQSWNAFTNEYNNFFASKADEILEKELIEPSQKTMKAEINKQLDGINRTKMAKKTIAIKPIGIDPSFKKKLEVAMTKSYISLAGNRRVVNDDDEMG